MIKHFLMGGLFTLLLSFFTGQGQSIQPSFMVPQRLALNPNLIPLEGEIHNMLALQVLYKLQIKENHNKVLRLYINSSGGVVDAAFFMADAIKFAKVDCYVDYAASAAFQIILPACSTIIFHPDSKVQWHSTHLAVSSDKPINTLIAQQLALALENYDRKMASHLTLSWGPVKCPLGDRPFKAVSNGNCVREWMYGEPTWGPQEFLFHFPQSKRKVVVVPSDMFMKYIYGGN